MLKFNESFYIKILGDLLDACSIANRIVVAVLVVALKFSRYLDRILSIILDEDAKVFCFFFFFFFIAKYEDIKFHVIL